MRVAQIAVGIGCRAGSALAGKSDASTDTSDATTDCTAALRIGRSSDPTDPLLVGAAQTGMRNRFNRHASASTDTFGGPLIKGVGYARLSKAGQTSRKQQ